MNWKQKTIARILLLVAAMLCEDDKLRSEIGYLSNHIYTGEKR